MKELLHVTCTILKDNFYYDNDALDRFLYTFKEHMTVELIEFGLNTEREVLAELHHSYRARWHFTCYFISAHMREIFLHTMHFSEQELFAFDNILPKYLGAKQDEIQPNYERENNREFFK
jgi:hypothetical protein